MAEYGGKLENLLIVSLNSTERERALSDELSAGVDEKSGRWEIVLKFYADSEDEFAEKIRMKFSGTEVTVLLCGYCIVETEKQYIEAIAGMPEVAYVEKAKMLYPDLINGKRESCLPAYTVKQGVFENGQITDGKALSGKGVIVAVIDTGINVDAPEFKNADGTTRIIRLWDMQSGRVYDSSDIDDEIKKKESPEIFGENQALFYDYSNHGINVSKIACGNDGVAYGASILFVRLKRAQNGYSNTTDMMRAIDFCVRTAIKLNMPVAVNISYGSSYGSHLTDDIQTAYINDVCNVWKSAFCVAAGNDAQEAVHAHVKLKQSETAVVELAVRDYEQSVSFALWYNSINEITIKLFSPSGEVLDLLSTNQKLNQNIIFQESAEGILRAALDGTEIISYTGTAKPYSDMNEVYVGLNAVGTEDYVTSGVWRIAVTGVSVKEENVNMWLLSAATLNQGTGFLRPGTELTYTIPSTARNVISVGSYNALTMTPSPFSGRGFVTGGYLADAKPDIVAPGENIQVDAKTVVTGTSFAAPFVTGAAALLMEWGIVDGNDSYMYGDRLKSSLKKGARQLSGQPVPSSVTGWGRLCVRESLAKFNK